jgi:hypothetical protein
LHHFISDLAEFGANFGAGQDIFYFSAGFLGEDYLLLVIQVEDNFAYQRLPGNR